MEFTRSRIARFALCAAVAAALIGCSGPDVRNETVATANGEKISVRDAREIMGIRGGFIAAPDMPGKRKEDAVDRLIAGRLIAQEARAKGLDGLPEFRDAVAKNEQNVVVAALLRKELDAVKVSKGEIDEEAKALRQADAKISEKEASARAGQVVVDKKLRKIEEDLVGKARKEFPANIDRSVLGRIGAGETVPPDTVLATVGADRVRYGDVAAMVADFSPGSHGGQDLAKNPMAIERALERDLTVRALAAYGKKSGIGDSPQAKLVRQEMERAVLIEMYASREVRSDPVTDAEVQAAYKEHEQTLVREGKKVPFAEAKGQIRQFLENEGKRKAFAAKIDELRKKAKVTVDTSVLGKI